MGLVFPDPSRPLKTLLVLFIFFLPYESGRVECQTRPQFFFMFPKKQKTSFESCHHTNAKLTLTEPFSSKSLL
ncbi:hypothetical protein QBC38DRAFT_471435 [Podospora fimiseda]|uniref:Secreted protein n=1 Tax=Podospora fimiseda TaxID=252190 RepID=A0AAN7H5K0_9PEZI|nr:hypothetical protein QBC38DRAFT_471435 [Podospora fimiseda]